MYTRRKVLTGVVVGAALAGCSGTAGSLPPAATAPAMAANEISKLEGTIPAVRPVSDPGKALLIGVSARLQLDATASPPVVTTKNGEHRAAPGQHLLAVKFHLRGEFRDDRPKGTYVNSLALILDGTRTVLDPDDLTTGENVLGLSIPDSAKEVSFELATGDLKQQVSLSTGTRIADGPVLLYRTDAKENDQGVTLVSASVLQRLSFPFALYDSRTTTPVFTDTYPTVVDVQKADLDYAIGKPNGELLYPSTPDKAFLTLHTTVSGGNSWMTVLDKKKSKQVDGSHVLDYHDAKKSFPVQF